jgi:hypothetical protein
MNGLTLPVSQPAPSRSAIAPDVSLRGSHRGPDRGPVIVRPALTSQNR